MAAESKLEKAATDFAKSVGWTHNKIMQASRIGFPDHWYLRNGRTLLIEYKAPKKPLSPKQVEWRDEILAHGGETFKIDDIAQAYKIFR